MLPGTDGECSEGLKKKKTLARNGLSRALKGKNNVSITRFKENLNNR